MGRPTRDTRRDLPVEKHLLHKKKKENNVKTMAFASVPHPRCKFTVDFRTRPQLRSSIEKFSSPRRNLRGICWARVVDA